MAVRNATEPLVKVTLNLYRSDYEGLKELYPASYSTFLRYLLRNHLIRHKQKMNEAATAIGEVDVNLETE